MAQDSAAKPLLDYVGGLKSKAESLLGVKAPAAKAPAKQAAPRVDDRVERANESFRKAAAADNAAAVSARQSKTSAKYKLGGKK